ncbi:ribonuclease P protein component 1 [Candidatus Halobonum tyrrellensis]|uniref:Ribonuclease P protein component 1 n=1 Tax=Candidatus Halobonum tyrrellensis G22 TaxID=1324957 RepID=V4HE12_9EURY|nr:ribonuclease P protein component 1 [Candidatus Halobonum tyrrellensis]ESP88900.1 rnase p/rnase mrp subunit p29 [Candidatus Halobonum tyrrellensis G22]
MPLTPETLTRHELVGLPVGVADAPSDAHVGIAGRVVSESQRTLVVRVPSGEHRDKRVPKAGATFTFALPSAAGTDEADGSVTAGDARASHPTDEAAGARKPPGSAFELPSSAHGTLVAGRGQDDTAGVTPGQSGGCEDAVYVTVDGTRLLSRPAFRTERAGDSTWQ